MHHPTSHYSDLLAAVRDARVIARRVPANAPLNLVQGLKVQALVLFSHSAFEAYLEAIGWAVAQEAIRIHDTEARITRAFVALMTSKLIVDLTPNVARRLNNELINNMSVFVREANNRYRSVIDSNHGVKERDQKNLLFPIGIDPETVDVILMNNLNAFGTTRGSIAHLFQPIRNELTLADVESKIAAIVTGLATIDAAACNSLA